MKSSIKQRLVEQGITAGEEAIDRAKVYKQTGKGIKRRRTTTKQTKTKKARKKLKQRKKRKQVKKQLF